MEKEKLKFSKAISLRLKELLKNQHITQQQFRKDAGVSKSTFKDLMNARYNTINLVTLKDIIRTLNISISNFFDSPLFDDGNLIGD